MIKEIPFSGLSAVPSDYACPDGSLDLSLNLIAEDSQIKPLTQPKAKLLLNNRGKLLLLHNVLGGTNFIILRGGRLYWLPEPSDESSEIGSDASATEIESFTVPDDAYIHDAAAFGNLIVLATADGIRTVMYADGQYTYLGTPPDINLEFALESSPSDTGNVTLPAFDTPINTDERRHRFSDACLGAILERCNNVAQKGLFTMPFFVRCAWRLYTGDHIMHTAPVLMLPCNTLPPTGAATDASFGNTEWLNPCRLLFRRVYNDLDRQSLTGHWRKIITGIDIYVSRPIWTFDQSADLDGATTPISADFDGIYAPRYAAATFKFDRQHLRANSSVFKPNENFEAQIRECANFYKLSALTLEQYDESASYTFDSGHPAGRLLFHQIPISDNDLTNLATRETLSYDFRARHILKPRSLHVYNNRLHLLSLSYDIPASQGIRTLVAYQGNETADPDTMVSIAVSASIDGKTYTSERRAGSYYPQTLYQIDSAYNLSARRAPVYIFYPDPNARSLVISDGTNSITLPLTTHEGLDGAYYFRGFSGQGPNIMSNTAFAADPNVEVRNKLYVSEPTCPWVFNAASTVTIPFGNIIALSSAAKALSQGQFGQFPLYAFTDEGVWALETNSTGTYSARQPITRDVILPGSSPLQMDNSVLFATARGLMLLSGSDTRCISDTIRSDSPFDSLSLPHMDCLHRTVHNFDDTCLPTRPFTEFISNCVMIYDYVHQHIVVGNPDYTYAYVFSLKSQMWGMIYSRISAGVPSYPYAYAMSQGINGNPYDMVVDFCNTINTSTSKGLLVTRPIKLETPDVLKTIDTAIVRGNFAKGKVQTVLYGSRDLIHWHLVWSSKDQYLRGFRGTPYKYFRIACVTNLADGESLFGTTLQFTPRLTDQPR